MKRFAPPPQSLSVQRARPARFLLHGLLLAGFLTGGVLFFASAVRSDSGPATPPPIGEEPPAAASGKKSKKEAKVDFRRSIDEFYSDKGPTPTFHFDFIPAEWEYLKKDPRRYADASMWEESTDRLWRGAAVKCKGSAGSFQNPDQKPGLSISMNKYKGAERWNGFLKWHLNNGAQDNTYLNEEISCEMARAAGVPASRCAHAFVKLQGRDLGLFVFKEAFDPDFLSHFFKRTDGDLYEGGFVRDVEVAMEKEQGDPDQRDNLKELIGACQEGDLAKRRVRLEKILDIDKYLSFLAIESITTHWDGYNFNHNNYRLYFDAETGKACFFLHGTDQTFGDANVSITREPGAMVGTAVMSIPEWKRGYREHVEKIYNEVLKTTDWPGRAVEVGEKVKAAMALRDPAAAKEYGGRINEARDRIANRIAGVAKQLGDLPHPLKFDQDGVAVLKDEGWRQEGSAATFDQVEKDGRPCLHIRADGESNGSWRRSLTLEAGKYLLEARVTTAHLVGSKTSSGEGAGLRISGGTRENGATCDTPWKDISFPLESPGGDVVLVAELRGSKGEVWFDRGSFRVRQVK